MDDIERATDLGREMVTRMGLGRRTGLPHQSRPHDPAHVSEDVRLDIRELLDDMYTQAVAMVESHRDWFERHRVLLREEATVGASQLQEGLVLAS